MDGYRFAGQRICANTQLRTDVVEVAVWQEVCQLLEDPQRLEREYRRRGQARPRGAKWETPESLRAQSNKLQRGIARLIDGYAEGLIGKAEFEPRIKRMKQRVTALEDQLQQLADEAVQQRELRLLIGRLEEFVAKVQRGLVTADWQTKREIIRALVRRVEIDKQEVTVVFRVGADPFMLSPERGSSQHCWGRQDRPLWHPFLWLNETAIGQLHGRCPPALNVQQHPWTIRVLSECPHQQPAIQMVKTSRDVEM
jgi:site-specific DNA recombinase